jgi:Flp pilus assembly protein TadD
MHLAGIYTDSVGDQQKALELAKKAREVLTDNPELAKTLGKIAYRRSDFANAIAFLKESSAKRSEDAEVFYFLGMSQYRQKEKEESKSALDRALTLSPNAAFAPEVKKTLAELGK